MNFGIKAPAPSLSTNAVRIIPKFGAGGYVQPFWFVSKITKRFGAEPSSATIECCTNGWGGDAPMLAVGNGPMRSAKGYESVECVKDGTIVFLGNVVVNDTSFDADGAVLEILDARWILEGGNFVGSFWVSNDGQSMCYRQGIPSWFNKGGLPNRRKGTNGFTYAFCESNYGIVDGKGPSDPYENDEDVATYWTPDSIWTYLIEMATPASVEGYVGAFKEYWTLPSNIIIPKNAANAITQFTATANTPPVGLRKADELIIHATPVNHALQKVLEMSGPYALGTTFNTDGKTTITIVNSKNIGGESVRNIAKANGRDVDAYLDGVCVGGGVKFDYRQHFTQVVRTGNLVYVETRCGSSEKTKYSDQQDSKVELITGWNRESIEKEIIERYNLAIDNSVPITIDEIIAQYPGVFETWQLNTEVDFSAGTSEVTFPFCKTTSRAILPHLLSTVSDVNPRGDTPDANPDSANSNLTMPQPIWIEIGTPGDDDAHDNGTTQQVQIADNGTSPPQSGNEPPSPDAAPDPGNADPGYEDITIGPNPNYNGGDGQ